MVVDPNDFKAEIVSAVKSATGRDITIRDDMNLSIFPTVAIQLGGVSLSNAEGFDAKYMAVIEELDLKVAVMPLLSGSLEVDKIVVRGLELNLAKTKSGKTNWDDLIGGEKTAASDPDDSTAADLSIQIKGIVIERAKLIWDDQQSGQRYELHDLQLKTGTIASGKDVPIDLSVILKSASPAQTFDLALSAVVTANDELSKLTIADLIIDLAAAGEGLPNDGLDLQLNVDVDFDKLAGTVALNNITLTGANLALSGTLNGKGLNGEPADDLGSALKKGLKGLF